ncbi:unnamed protein product [Paramecium pentaurelia]|uniref:Uncharacterized protein n=1 Tax=Paramecium pentaurelia TaxID=43138 RepID=A0A8S1VKX3_9CILI|nr:unnamed protein product [Paramecium pentaurelia]
MIQALSKIDPIQQYYVNDHYVHSISAKEFRTNQSYSPKALIQGYWKKDYQTLMTLNCSTEEQRITLPQISTKSYQVSDTKIEKESFETTNSFNKNICADLILQKYKIKPGNANNQQQRKEKEHIKLPGKLIKGSFQYNKNIGTRVYKKYNNELSIERLDIKQQLTPKPTIQSTPPSNTSLDCQINQIKPVFELQKPIKIQYNKPQTPNPIQEQIIRKELINKVQLKSLLIRTINQQISNLALIQFDELLGFLEGSYYGLQFDFVQSDLYFEYQNTKEHYFQKLLQNSQIYILKNLKEALFSLSKLYQIILITENMQKQLVEYVNLNKLPISAIYQIKLSNVSFIGIKTIDCYQIMKDLQIKKINKIALIQTYELLYKSNDAIKQIQEQNILYPYENETRSDHFYILMLPSLCMQSLLKTEQYQSKLFLHSLYFIEQFCQSILFDNVKDYCAQKIHPLLLQDHYQNLKDNITVKIQNIDSLKQQPLIQQQRYSKKEMIARISEKFENQQKFQELSQDLVLRNKKIIKRISRYKQEQLNILQIVKDQLTKEHELLHYCQKLLDNCYYIIF